MKLLKLYFILFSSICFSQSNEYQLKINTLTLPLAITNIAFEYPINNKMTLQADGLISPWKSLNGRHFQIYMGNMEGRYYFKEAFRKWYVGPNIGFAFFDMQKWNYWNKPNYQRGFTILMGATVGYQFNLTNRLNLDLFGTIGYSMGEYKGYKEIDGKTIRYDSATAFNKSGEFLPYKAGLMLTYKFKKKRVAK